MKRKNAGIPHILVDLESAMGFGEELLKSGSREASNLSFCIYSASRFCDRYFRYIGCKYLYFICWNPFRQKFVQAHHQGVSFLTG